MSLAGYRRAIEGIIVGSEVKDVKIVPFNYEKVSLDQGKYAAYNVWASVVVAVKTVDGLVYEACGDANYAELDKKNTAHFLVRIAESRARKRAYAQALGITPEDFYSDTTRKSRMEDIDTPLTDLAEEEAAGGNVEKEKTVPVKKGPSLDELLE